MRSRITIAVLILFFNVSTFGDFVVGYCSPIASMPSGESGDCDSPDGDKAESEVGQCQEFTITVCAVGEAQKPVTEKRSVPGKPPRRVPAESRCVLPVVLALDSTAIPRGAMVCIVRALSELREGPKSEVPPADLHVNRHSYVNDISDVSGRYLHNSLPSGIHPIISTTVLRL